MSVLLIHTEIRHRHGQRGALSGLLLRKKLTSAKAKNAAVMARSAACGRRMSPTSRSSPLRRSSMRPRRRARRRVAAFPPAAPAVGGKPAAAHGSAAWPPGAAGACPGLAGLLPTMRLVAPRQPARPHLATVLLVRPQTGAVAPLSGRGRRCDEAGERTTISRAQAARINASPRPDQAAHAQRCASRRGWRGRAVDAERRARHGVHIDAHLELVEDALALNCAANSGGSTEK